MNPKKKRKRTTGSKYNLYKTKPGKKQKLNVQQRAVGLVAQLQALYANGQQPPGQGAVPAQGARYRGDGLLRVRFVAVGQGDCIIIGTPAGTTIMIDCGAGPCHKGDSGYVAARVQAALADPVFCGGRQTIDILILTHPDADHYNFLNRALAGYTVTAIYHSDDLDEYVAKDAQQFFTTAIPTLASRKKVVLHREGATAGFPAITVNGVHPGYGTALHYVDRLDPADGLRIADPASGSYRVTIIAAGVDSDLYPNLYDPGTARNQGSVVTMVEKGATKLLFCGDATLGTERYLLSRQRVRIQNVALMSIGHHGSDLTSSSAAFALRTNPAYAVVNAAAGVPKDHLPSHAVLNRFKGGMETGHQTRVARHSMQCWQGMSSRNLDTDVPIYTTGSNGYLGLTGVLDKEFQ